MFKISNAIRLFQEKIKLDFIRFILVGGINTLFGYGVYCLLIFFGIPYVWSTLVSQILGVLFNFMTTGTLVFENRDNKLIFKFVSVYILTYFINIGFNRFLQILLTDNKYITGIGATVVSAIFSFFILKYYVYKKK